MVLMVLLVVRGAAAGMMAARRPGRQRDACWLLALFGACLLAACARQQPPQPALRVGLAQPVLDVDPRRAADAASARIGRLLYSRLVELDADFRPRPAAADWRQLDDRHWRFTLRSPRPRFADGAPLMAADVAATYGAVLGAGAASPLRGELGSLVAVTAVDERSVDFTLSAADPLFPARLTQGLLPARCASPTPAGGRPCHYDGSGPFVLQSLSADRVVLQRRRDGLRVEFLLVPDPTTRVLKLLRGELDLLQNDLPPELVAYLEQQSAVSVLRGPGSSYHYLGFNLADPVTGDLRLRRAVAHGIDRAALIRHLLGGAARPAGSVLPPSHYAAAELPEYRHDPALARRLLAEAGIENPRLTYRTSTDPLRVRIATAIQAQLAAVGIRVRVQSTEWGSFFDAIRGGQFQMYSLAWVGVTQPDALRQLFHSASVPPAGANRGRFADPAVDALLDAAAGAEPAQQTALYQAAQRRIHAELPYVPLWYEDNVAAVRAGVRGYALRPDGAWDALDDTDPPDARHPH
jgi:peptide/nickel transport system substrate-binding protein